MLNFLWGKVSFRHLAFAAGLHAFVSYGAGTRNALFFIRIHEMSSTDLGAALALVAGIGAIGTFGGGYLSDKLSERTGDKRWYFWVPGIATAVMVPFQLVAYLYDGTAAICQLVPGRHSRQRLSRAVRDDPGPGVITYARCSLGDFAVCVGPYWRVWALLHRHSQRRAQSNFWLRVYSLRPLCCGAINLGREHITSWAHEPCGAIAGTEALNERMAKAS